MNRILVIVVHLQFIQHQGRCFEMRCDFVSSPKGYGCETSAEFKRNLSISSTAGYHQPNHSNVDVNYFEITKNSATSFVPHNISSQFPQLTKIFIYGKTTQTISRQSFAACENVQTLSISGTMIYWIPEDTFMDMESLLNLDLSGNKIKVLPYKLLANNRKLQSFAINDNELEVIELEFSGTIGSVDLRNNICINTWSSTGILEVKQLNEILKNNCTSSKQRELMQNCLSDATAINSLNDTVQAQKSLIDELLTKQIDGTFKETNHVNSTVMNEELVKLKGLNSELIKTSVEVEVLKQNLSLCLSHKLASDENSSVLPDFVDNYDDEYDDSSPESFETNNSTTKSTTAKADTVTYKEKTLSKIESSTLGKYKIEQSVTINKDSTIAVDFSEDLMTSTDKTVTAYFEQPTSSKPSSSEPSSSEQSTSEYSSANIDYEIKTIDNEIPKICLPSNDLNELREMVSNLTEELYMRTELNENLTIEINLLNRPDTSKDEVQKVTAKRNLEGNNGDSNKLVIVLGVLLILSILVSVLMFVKLMRVPRKIRSELSGELIYRDKFRYSTMKGSNS